MYAVVRYEENGGILAVRGAEGGWLYAKGEVGYEASPVVEHEAN